MANEWREIMLVDLIHIRHGYAFKGQFINDEQRGDILLTPGNFAIGGGFKFDKLKYYEGPVPEEYVLQENDLLVTMTDLSKQSDTLGYPAFVPKSMEGRRFLHNQRLGKVILKSGAEADARFIYFLLCSAEYRHEVFASSTGTTVKHTSPDRIGQFRLHLPPLPEQRAIAHILGTLDDKIELNRRMNETLEAMARALFKSWFVDFDPVRAKMAGDDTGLPPHIAALFPDRLVDSELGEIPAGWEASTLGKHVNIFDSKRIPLSRAEREKRQGIYPYHGATGVMDHVNDYLFDGIYLLVGEDGSVSDARGLAVTQYVWGKLWVNNHAHVLQGKSPVGTEHVYLHLHFEPVLPFVTGAVQPKLSQGRMKKIPFVYPDAPLCAAFNRMLAPLFEKVRASNVEAQSLASLRDTLLPKLISGELRVRDADSFLERAL